MPQRSQDEKAAGEETPTTRLIKYMGSSDVCILEKGEDWNKRLADPLEKDVVFDKADGHIANVEDLSPEAVELILEDPRFKDVTSLKRIPANDHEKIFGAVADNPTPHLVNSGVDSAVETKGEQGSGPTATTATALASTPGAAGTVGGSTSTPASAGPRP